MLYYDPEADELFFVYAKGLDENLIREIRLKRGKALLAPWQRQENLSLFKTVKMIRVSDKQKTGSLIAVPIKYKDMLFGVLELVNLEKILILVKKTVFIRNNC